MKKLCAVLFVICLMYPVFAQAQTTKVNLSLIVKDSVSTAPIEAVTVSLVPKGSTSASKYGVTNAQGVLILKDVTKGVYSLSLDMMGYNSKKIEVNVTGDKNPQFLGDIVMREDVTFIESVVVTATGNPIVAKKDTLEYNTSSFHTTENATLEDLLKKFPGAEISSDGTITMNGKTISKVMIDGKEFFADDPQIATKNLPAKIVEKVRVVDRKSDQTRFSGIEDGDEETVLDLTIQKGMMNGIFGSLTGGFGNEKLDFSDDNRYQGGGMIARFTDKSQLSAIASVNNTNNRGFSDIVGNMMGGMRSGGPGGMGGGGMGGMWGRNEGITTSYMGGLNGGATLAKGKLEINGNYMYSGSDKDQEQRSNRENLLPDNHFFYNQEKTSNTTTDGHRAGFDVEYNWNDKNQLIFRPRFNIGSGSFEDKSSYESYRDNRDIINSGSSLSAGESNSTSINGSLMYAHRFKKPGHTFSINSRYSYENSDIDGLNKSETFIAGNDGGKDSTAVVNQQYYQLSKSWSLQGRASYTIPIADKRYLELSYSYRYNQRNSSKEAFNFNAVSDRYDIVDPDYTNEFNNTFINQQAGINYRSNQNKYRLTLGFNVQPSYTRSEANYANNSRDTVITLSVINFAPNAQFEYTFRENSELRIDYNGRTEQPSINQLSPVPDNSNPLYVRLGNPELKPKFTHRLRANFMDTRMETFRTIFARLEMSYTMDNIVNKTWYDESGVQYSQPVNQGSSISASGSIMYNTPIARSKFYIGNDLWLRFSKGDSYSQAQLNHTQNYGVYETLRFTYRGDMLNASISGRAGYSLAIYSLESSKNSNTWNNRISADIDWTTPWWGLSLESDFSYNFYKGYGDNYNQDAMIWNASIEKLLFKKRATLALKGYDLLNQAVAIRRSTTDNYIEDTETNVLRQYFMLTFTYRFGTFGGNNGMRGGPMRGPGGRGHGPGRR